MKQLLSLTFLVFFLFTGVGCQQQPTGESAVPVQTLPDAPEVETVDPATALDEIYSDIQIMGIEDANEQVLKDKFFIEPEMIEEYYVRYSSGRFGLADVFILYPADKQRDILREKLEDIKLNRANEFVDYDIYNAHEVAQNAVIFEQGGYLIMLMLEDNESARETINRYIPKN